MMKNATNINQALERLMLDILKDGALSRTQLLSETTQRYCDANNIKRSAGASSRFSQIKSYVGTIINRYVAEGKIEELKGQYSLPEALVKVDATECLRLLPEVLKAGGLTKKQIFAALDEKIGTGKTQSRADDDRLHCVLGQILERGTVSGSIIYHDGVYSLPSKQIQKSLSVNRDKEQVFDALFALLWEKGGRNFEFFVCNLLEKYYSLTDKSVVSCRVLGGSNDGGIDCAIDTVDELGFGERVLVQCKCRNKIQATEKEIREFVGAVNIQDGTRGMFVTTADFHPSAQKLLDSIPHCVGINRQKLKEIIDKTGYGVIRSSKGYRLDLNVLS